MVGAAIPEMTGFHSANVETDEAAGLLQKGEVSSDD